MTDSVDAVVVGAGPNGLAAAVVLARAGLSVKVLEGAATPGGGCRTEELTLPGFRHDVCSTAHPLAIASPFFREFDLAARGVRLRHPEVEFAHPLDGARAGAVLRSVADTADLLGADGPAYRNLMTPLVDDADAIVDTVLAPIRSLPRHPLALGRYGWDGMLRSATGLARSRFDGDEARGVLAGVAAHSMLRLDKRPTAAFGLLLTLLAHRVGWPVVEGGSAALVDAMVAAVEAAGGEVVTGQWIRSLDELPKAKVTLLDLTPHQLLALAGDRLSGRGRRSLERFRYGPGVFKVDWALSGAVPWANEHARRAGTLHLGGSLDEVALSESSVAAGRVPDSPYTLVVQPSVVDPTRAPTGKQVLWAYCHVPAGCTDDMTERIERQIERFAPGFRDLVLARSVRNAAEVEAHNPNYVGGDINGGVASIRQVLFRPTVRWDPFRTPLRGVYLCSSSTPPGGGVHGMCGYWAAKSALRREFGISTMPSLAPTTTHDAQAA